MRAALVPVALAALCAAGPALACSCARGPNQPKPPYLVLASVTAVTTAADGKSAVARLKVVRPLIGRTEGTITVRALTSSAACGVTFSKGARQFFGLQKKGSGYTTNLCLMLQARQ